MTKIVFYRVVSCISVLFLIIGGTGVAQAASNSDFTQVITAGSLAVDILNASRVAVGSPSVGMSAKNFSFECLNGGNASTGTLGTNTERLYAINPGASVPNGWNVTIAGTGGAAATWANNGATQKFDFNDPTGSGCTDGADAGGDTFGGQMTIDPSVGTLTADCGSCATTGITKGGSTAFNQGTTDSVALLTAADTVSNPFRGYLTDVGISQTIPAEQPPDATYKLNLTLTITAL